MRYKTTAEVFADKHGAPISAYANLTKSKPGDSAIAKHEKARQKRIMASPTSREASDDDVEHFEDSLKKVYYHARAGA